MTLPTSLIALLNQNKCLLNISPSYYCTLVGQFVPILDRGKISPKKQINYSGDPKTGHGHSKTGPFENRTFFSQDHFIYTEKKFFIKWSRLVVFGRHFEFLPFEIRTTKTSGFRMNPDFECLVFRSLLYLEL